MFDLFNFIKDVAGWLFLAIIGMLVWFFKSIYSQHQAMHEYYNKIKDFDFTGLKNDLQAVKLELQKVEFESKKYWNQQKIQIESNQQILLERICAMGDQFKSSQQSIKDLFHNIERRIEKLED